MKARGGNKIKTLLNSWLFIQTYHQNLAIWGKKNPFEIWWFRSIFSMKSFWYKLKSYFLGQNLVKIHQ
jgi:hypothetical protein